MNIAVLIKMVPDTESKLEVNAGELNDQNFKYMVNPYDEFAVEQAVNANAAKITKNIFLKFDLNFICFVSPKVDVN